MPAFRDDREGLRQRLVELEQELTKMRSGERTDVMRRLADLETELVKASSDLEQQRVLLERIAGQVRALREADDAQPREPPRAEPPREPASAPPRPITPSPRSVRTTRRWPFVVGALVLIGALSAWYLRRSPEESSYTKRPLPGAPHAIHPAAVLDEARTASNIRGELAAIEAVLVADGVVDLDRRDGTRSPLVFYFFDDKQGVEVHAAPDGFTVIAGSAPDPQYACNASRLQYQCGASVPVPRCSWKQIWEAARKAGAVKDDRLVVLYGVNVERDAAKRRPVWQILVESRGLLVIEDGRCEAPAGQRISPPARPLSAIPGGPHAVDPMALLETAKLQSGLGDDAVLTQIELRFVKRNGRIDLDASHYRGYAFYYFADPPVPRDPALPPGVLPADRRRAHRVSVSKEGMPIPAADPDASRVPVAPPQCTVARLFELAKLPENALAQMNYRSVDETPDRPGRWAVDVPGVVSGRIVDDAQCGTMPPAEASATPAEAKRQVATDQ